MELHGRDVALGLGAWVAVLAAVPGPANALYETERIVFRPSISVQGTFHHDGARTFDAVQERNEFRGELKYRLVLPERPLGMLSLLDFNMLYRARYDAIFDIRESYRDRGYDRDDFRFPEGKVPRELYF
ncbi:MAG: hypothetical protein ACREQJ_10625, partial [Candidatus Binatia bacterium]